MAEPGHRLVAYYVAWKSLAGSAGSLAFVLIGLWLMAMPSTVSKFVGGASILFFGATGIGWVSRLWNRQAILVIDSHGIFDRRIIDRVVPWAAIADLGHIDVNRQRFIGINLREPIDSYSYKLGKRILRRANALFGYGLYVGAQGLDVSLEDIEREISYHMASGAPSFSHAPVAPPYR